MRQAALSSWSGVANVGGGERVSMRRILALVTELVGPVHIEAVPGPPGDARHTGADTTVAREAFGYRPRTGIRAGLAAMAEETRKSRPAAAPASVDASGTRVVAR